MKRLFTFTTALSVATLATSTALAQQSRLLDAPSAPTAAYQAPTGSLAAYYDDAPEAPVPADEAPPEETTADDAAAADCGYNDNSCGCYSGCCDNSYGFDCFGDCCLGEAWTLKSCLTPCCDSPNYGGWISAGFYTNNEPLSFEDGDTLSFNDNPDELNLDQAWLWVERVAQGDACSCDYGYRLDIMYGAQAHAAQSFGNDPDNWDEGWDHGIYGWAIPQAYVEAAYGDLSTKVGHFWTVAGYEVVPATGNFFYTHSLTFYNSEPFTHTGALATYKGIDDTTLYGGWVLGWDTGFDQFESGNAFLGGATYEGIDDITLTYIVTAGNLGWKSNGDNGFSGSFVGVATLSENMEYVLAHDYLSTDQAFNNPALQIDDKSIVNYLFYTLNDCWKLGTRAEWWRSNQLTGREVSYYEVSTGVNYRPHANLVLRPEVRYDWTPAEDNVANTINEDYNQWMFAMDAVFTF